MVRGRADLPRQAAGELGPGARHHGVRPRGRQRGRRRPDLGNSLSRRWIRDPRSDSAAGNHAGRRRGRGSPFRRPVRQPRRQAGRPAADGEKNSGHRGRVRRSRVRHRRAQDHAGPRLQRLRSRQAPRAGAHQHPEARRSPQRPGARQVPRTRALRSPEKNPSRFESREPPRLRKAVQAARAALRPHRRHRRADAERPVVRENGEPRPGRAGCGRARRGEIHSGALDGDLQPLAEEHQGLADLAPALVGPPDTGLVRRRGQGLRRQDGSRGAPEARDQGLLATRSGRARHLVLVPTRAVQLARLARPDARPRGLPALSMCWSPATTSSFSGYRA